MKAATHTAELHAWLSPHHRIEGLFDQEANRILPYLSYSVGGPDTQCWERKSGYTYVGKATVSVDMGGRDDIVAAKVAGLKAEKQEVLATAQAKATEIDGQIQKLLAITFDGASA